MNALVIVLGCLCLVGGYVGCVVPAIPGPVLAYASLLLLLLTDHPPGATALLAGGVLTLLAVVLDYVVPAMGARRFRCSRGGIVGCTLGSVVGMFFVPFGVLLGPFVGAVVGELLSGRNVWAAMKGGLGAFLGFLCGVMLKIVACGILTAMFLSSVFGS